jgi:hypothetical protein
MGEPAPVIIEAVLSENTALFHLLREHGVAFNTMGAGGVALQLAAKNGLESMVELLLAEGFPVHGTSCRLLPFAFLDENVYDKETHVDEMEEDVDRTPIDVLRAKLLVWASTVLKTHDYSYIVETDEYIIVGLSWRVARRTSTTLVDLIT